MKKRVLLALLVSAMTLTAMPGVTFAGSNADSADNGGLSYEGYTQVWGDEFNGDSLNRDDWNVETHKKGWVNSELQEYVDSEDVSKPTHSADYSVSSDLVLLSHEITFDSIDHDRYDKILEKRNDIAKTIGEKKRK